MPQKHLIIGLKSIAIDQIKECEWLVEIHGHLKGRKKCPHCGSFRVQSRGVYTRRLKHARQAGRLVELLLTIRKLRCKACKRTGMQRIPHVLPRRRATEPYRQDVFELHQGGLTQKHLSRTHKISGSTVERWFWDFIGFRIKELRTRRCPKVLGIDEHFFTRRHGYATTFVDLKKHHVFDVVLGRSQKSLHRFLSNLKGREQVQVVVMDLSETYRSIVQKYFPNAMIVADRFHVVRLVSHHFQKLWAAVDPVGRKNRGLLSLFRRNRKNMSPEQAKRLEAYLNKLPALKIFDDLQQKLLSLLRLKHLSRRQARHFIPQMLSCIEKLHSSGISQLQTIASTVESWLPEIVRMWRFTKTNSITEGFHNKMEMISRRAYGFRNFQNYRLRVIALCGWNGLFNRIDL